jgi:hypothetical protein
VALIHVISAAGLLAGLGLSSVSQDLPAAPDPLARDNLLVNPGLEDGFHESGAQEVVVGTGWTAWYDGSLSRPEMKDEPFERRRDDGTQAAFSVRVFHGTTVQKMFTSSSSHDAGMYQVVPVPAGQRVRFSMWVQAWSSDCDDPCVSPLEPCRSGSTNTHGTYRVQLGVEPTGRVPAGPGSPAPDSVTWSEAIVYEAYDRWFRLEVSAMSSGTEVAVYTRGHPEWPVKHNDSYWDDARLEVVRDPATLERAYLPSVARYGALGRMPAPLPSTAGRAPPVAPTVTYTTLPARDPVPPGADIRIEYPVRAYPAQENFALESCADIEFESVLLANYGLVDVGLSGWALSDVHGSTYRFGDVTLAPGDRVRVWTKQGPDTTYRSVIDDNWFTDVYWGRVEGVWDGPGAAVPFDEAVLTDDQGTEVARRGYP